MSNFQTGSATSKKRNTRKEIAQNNRANKIFSDFVAKKYRSLNSIELSAVLNEQYQLDKAPSTLRGWLSFNEPIPKNLNSKIAEICGCSLEYLNGIVETPSITYARNEHRKLNKENKELNQKNKELEKRLKTLFSENKYLELNEFLTEELVDNLVNIFRIIETPILESETIYLGTKRLDNLGIIWSVFSSLKLIQTLLFEANRVIDYYSSYDSFSKFNDFLNVNNHIPYDYPSKIPAFKVAETNINKCLDDIFHSYVKNRLSELNLDSLNLKDYQQREISEDLKKYLDYNGNY